MFISLDERNEKSLQALHEELYQAFQIAHPQKLYVVLYKLKANLHRQIGF
jgi:hypothetical protein